MSKRSKRRRREKRLSKKNQIKVILETPQEVINKGNFKDAARLLRDQIIKEPTDDRKRLLGKCLIELQEYKEAISAFLDIDNKIFLDLTFVGWCFIQLEDWERAAQSLEESLHLKEDPETCYWLAVAKAKNRYNHQLDETTKNSILQLLNRAVVSPQCCLEAFLWLEELQGWSEKDVQERVKTLEEALARYPDSKETCLRLTSHLVYHLRNFERALETIVPLLAESNPTPEAFWYAFLALDGMGNFAAALNYLEAIQPDPEYHGVGLAKVKGDILLKLGRISESTACYDEEIETSNLEARIIGLFSRAWARLLNDDIPQAIDDTIKGAELWFNNYESFIPGDSIIINGEMFRYECTKCIEQVCESLLQKVKDGQDLDNELIGRLNYFLYPIYQKRGEDKSDLLLQAAKLIAHPRLSYDLSHYFVEAKELSLAVHHHLIFYLWAFDKLNDPYYSGFGPGKDVTINKKERAQIHKVAMKHLKACDDSKTIRNVFTPFYHSFWREVLFTGKMFNEVAEVTGIFIKIAPDNEYELFDYAYSLHEIGQFDKAENAYRQLLERQPDNSSALHNLSIILEQKGLLQESLELSSRASELAPNDALIVKRSGGLKEKVDQYHRESQKQEDFLRTAPERWPQLDRYKRQLLAALTVIHSFDNWEHLSKLTGIGEQYLPGHWRKLVELGMIVEEKDGKYHVNEHILPLVKQERSHSVITKIIHAEPTVIFKRPIFNSQLEYNIYNLLIGIFPNHLVFPNMSLQTIFQYNRMKEVLDSEDFRYFLMSQVDFCIVSTANYLPIIAFEVDSRYHDSIDQIERDTKKDRIFQVGGVPLLRLRELGRPTEQAMRQQIIEDVRAIGLHEINFELFGLKTTQNEF